MNLTPEEKLVGTQNYYESIGVSRRDFLKGVAAAGVTSGAGLGAMYFGYGASVSDPVRVGVIGTGDEGNVLIGAINPNYIEVKAICDIRPYNQRRAFFGDWAGPSARAARKGLMEVYGWKTHEEALKHVNVYSEYEDLLNDSSIEAVIIALPLFLHHRAAMAAMKAGKHVLTEKLMAYNVGQCKEMARLAERENLLLATGHQRHYSVLYDNAVNLLKWGLLGQIHHIRAQWHRNNLPGGDSWCPPLPGGEINQDSGALVDKIQEQITALEKSVAKTKDPDERLDVEMRLAQWKAWAQDADVDAAKYGYETIEINGRPRSALEELCRWRLWNRTGGGLMAELGSHQLDAASIFVSALRKDGKKAHPLSVHAVGGRHIFPEDRDAFDHVYCMFEFAGPEYEPHEDKRFYGYYDPVNNTPDPKKGIPGYNEDPNKRIVMTYSSINGNGYGGYGETVLGTKGTLVLEREQDLMVYKDSDTDTKVQVKDDGGGPAMMAYETGGSAAATAAQAAHDNMGPVSRGYTEEMEHWAWCIRNRDPENKPRCHPPVAMGDAIIALTTNVAMQQAAAGKSGYVDFQEEWFDVHHDATPDGSKPATV